MANSGLRPAIRRQIRLLWAALAVTLLVGITVLSTSAATRILPATAQAASDRTHAQAVERAWQRVLDSGSYAYSADVVQTSIPLQIMTNVGRRSSESSVHIEGATNLAADEMTMKLWSSGGSLLNADSGIELKVEDGQTWARHGDAAWEPVDDVIDWAAPGGDFLGFLAAATNVQPLDAQTDGLLPADAAGRVSGVVRYSFELDGPAFAAHVRQLTQARLEAEGTLRPGMAVGMNTMLRDMTGQGELWVDANGLPRRQIINVTFPPQTDQRLEAHIDVQFSGIAASAGSGGDDAAGTLAAAAGLFAPAQIAERTLAVATRNAPNWLMSAMGLLLAVGLVRFSSSNRVYRALSLTLVMIMVTTPLLSAVHPAAAAAPDAPAAPAEAPPFVAQPAPRGQEALALLAADDGRDSDQDGTSDVRELLLGSDPVVPEPLRARTGDDGTDTDFDGLTDFQEQLLDTDPDAADSDDDGISDYDEVTGFFYPATNGRWWYGDPNKLDSNGDGVDDAREWPTATFDGDTDGDNIPDLFDDDNDNDGVRDALDVSPFVTTQGASAYGPDNPFALIVNGLTAGEPAFVEFQLRPTNPDHLWYALNVLDWLKGDAKGQLQDTNGNTFHDVNPGAALNPSDNGDIRLTPMLEILVSGTPSNLPLAPWQSSTATVEPIPYQPASYSGQITFRQDGATARFETDFDFYVSALYKGSCANVRSDQGELIYASAGAYLHRTGGLYPDMKTLGNGEYMLLFSDADRRPGGCVQIPMIPYENDLVVDQPLLDRYGASARYLDAAGTDKAVYLPLNLVIDPDTGERVAFQVEMPYQAAATWGSAHEVRLVWTVTMLNDADEADRIQVVQTYPDTWFLTGLDVREDLGVEMAIVYEDPAVDANVNDDLGLIMLANGLDYAFLSGRDCDSLNPDGSCVGNGQRDVTVDTIAQRFNRTTNGAVPAEQRWNVSNTLGVVRKSYDSLYAMAVGIASVDAPAVLDSVFTPALATAGPISPTLLFASEIRFRATNLDLEPVDPDISWDGATLTIDMTASEASTVASLKWAPYQHAAAGWNNYPLDEYWQELGRRHRSDFNDETDPNVADGMLVGVQMYYATLNNGVQRTVQTANAPRQDDAAAESDQIITGVHGSVAASGRFIIKRIYLARIMAPVTSTLVDVPPGRVATFFRYLKALDPVAGEIDGVPLARAPFAAKQFNQLKLRGGSAVGVVAAVAVVAVITVGVLAATGVLGDGVAEIYFGSLSVVLQTAGLAITVASELKALRATEQLVTTVTPEGRLPSFRSLSKAAKVASVVGFVVEIGFIWGPFIASVIEGDLQPGTPAFNTVLALAIAATVVAVLLVAIAFIPVVGQIIVAVIGLIDALAALICAIDEESGACEFGITKIVTETLGKFFYYSNSIFDFEKDDHETVRLRSFDMALTNPAAGFVAGNQLIFKAAVGFSFYPNIEATTEYNKAQFSKPAINEMKLGANLSNREETVSASWVGLYNWSFVPRVRLKWALASAQDYYEAITPLQNLEYTTAVLPAGINHKEAVYLNLRFEIPTFECETISCDWIDPVVSDNSVQIAEDSLYFDVLPATLDEFYNWTSLSILDRDGDGLLDYDATACSAYGLQCGNDPNATTWDNDSDGLSDARELTLQAEGVRVDVGELDSDNDGLCDAQEVRLGTNPDSADSDGDSLTDAQEVYHQSCTDPAVWSGGWAFTYDIANSLTITVSSDPLQADADNDGLSDLTEKTLHLLDPETFPYHPGVFNESPLGIYQSISDVDGFVAVGQQFEYTTELANNLTVPLYADGTLTTQFPAALGGAVHVDTFSLFQQKRKTLTVNVTAQGGTQTVRPIYDLTAALGSSAGSSGAGTITSASVTERAVTIDADNPTNQATGSVYVQADGVRMVGGTASDPTSYVALVEGNGGRGWLDATGGQTGHLACWCRRPKAA